ncbi:hypothetical protein Pint_24215 [Pistacia integerrima]|uniref:Uncharacterized protein n=1 Tax=Pistacia integerrima TaxID=434235 RepID=A0ACC0YFJ0_9ROSI|nr:hypothetical protein Pint_24215 [Pistacia integerrima]
MASRIGVKVHKAEVTRSISETPPTHYTVTIQLFSLLSKNAEKYESAEFEAGGNKWKLVLHPNGNKNKNVANHISLYLAVADASSLPPDWEVSAVYRLFLLDQNKDNYLVAQEPQGKQRRFHRLKPERGFDRFIPTKVFSDASYGYLVDDTCELGAEVFVSKERSRGKAECLEMIKDPGSFKHVWKIETFSMLASEYYDSKEFTAAGFKWKMQLYPKGRDTGAGCISLYLVLADLTSLTPASKVYVDYTLRIQDQEENRHISFKKNHWFSASSRESGWARFFPLSFFLRPNDWVVNDVCFLEAEVAVQGITRSVSDTQQNHYTVTIQLFSLLSKNAEKYESAEFEAGGYKWKLVLYPNGNKSKNVADYISLYLAIADASLLPPDLQGKQRRFRRLKPEWGFDQFIPIKVFTDDSKGFLVDDTCKVGVQVFVSKESSTGRGECLKMIKDPRSFTYVWKIENFSKLDSEYYDSKEFTVAGFNWKMQLYPNGRDSGTGSHISLYLVLADLTSLTPTSRIYVDYTFRIQDQVRARDLSVKKNHWFSASSRESGSAKFLPLSFFLWPHDWVVKDVCFFEAEVTVRGIASTLQ